MGLVSSSEKWGCIASGNGAPMIAEDELWFLQNYVRVLKIVLV